MATSNSVRRIFSDIAAIFLLAFLICAGWFSPCFSQGNNPAGMSTKDPRTRNENPGEFPNSRGIEEVLKELGVRDGASESTASKRNDESLEGGFTDNNQALYFAAGSGRVEEALHRIRAAANVNYRDPKSGMTPLMTVEKQIQAAVLLAAGADVHVRDNEGQTALHHALFADEAEDIVRLLLTCGADVNARDLAGRQGPPLLAARELFFEDRAPAEADRIVKLLVESGADVDARDVQGSTILMAAVSKQRKELVSFLLNLGANPNVRTKDGVSALDLAERHGFQDIKRLIINAGGSD